MIGVKEMYLFTMSMVLSLPACNRDYNGWSCGVGHTEARAFNSGLDSAVRVVDNDLRGDGRASDENGIAVGVSRQLGGGSIRTASRSERISTADTPDYTLSNVRHVEMVLPLPAP